MARELDGPGHRAPATEVLQNLPPALALAPFALALTGAAWSQAAYVFGISSLPGSLITGFAAGMLVVVTVAHLLRLGRPGPRRHLRVDLAEPNRMMPFAALPAAAAVLAAAALPRAPSLSIILWIVAVAVLTLALAWALLRVLHLRQPVRHIGPPWLMASFGLMLLPIAGLTHGFVVASIVAYAAGLGLGLAVLTLMATRLMAARQYPPTTVPERALLPALPAIAVLGHQALNGGVLDADALVLMLLCVAGAVVTMRTTWAQARQRSSATWWSIPVIAASLTLVLLITYDLAGGRTLAWAAVAGLVGTSALAVYGTYRTLRRYRGPALPSKLFIERPEAHG